MADEFPTHIDPDIGEKVTTATGKGHTHNLMSATALVAALLLLVIIASWVI